MEGMSQTFKKAFAFEESNLHRAIELYDEEIKANPTNFLAWQKRGSCKLRLANQGRDTQLLEDSKVDFRTVIKLVNKDGSDFQIAENELKRAEETKFD